MLMPDVDGLELARLINADPETAGLPMIMLSSAPRLPQPMLAEVGVGALAEQAGARGRALRRHRPRW